MHHDMHGLPISTASTEAAAAFDRALTRLPEISRRCGPAAGRGVCRRRRVRAGALPEGLFRHALLQAGERAGRRRGRAARRGCQRACDAARAGACRRRSRPGSPAISTARSASGSRSWREHPRDVLAFRLAHFNNFWLGRPGEMRASVERVKPKWARDLPGYGTVLSCHCFSLEECGDYAGGRTARAAPRSRSIRATSGARMRSRTSWRCRAATPKASRGSTSWSGIWDGGDNLCIICGGTARCFISSAASSTRCSISTTSASAISAAPLTQAQPDLYIDVQNAASMLFRLELLGIDVGDRWNEIADKAEARIGDCLSAFTLPHWMMALAATGRDEAAQRMLDGDARVRQRRGTVRRSSARRRVADLRGGAGASHAASHARRSI